jgi:Nif-specific regulatory protein
MPKNEHVQPPLPEIVGTAAAMQHVYRLVRLAAPRSSHVLLIGETGTGKEVIARAVHKLSRRSDGPFVRVNCGALHENLLESELFGHVKGSFTGAVSDKVGRFEAAHGGTIFLDEINSTSPKLQVKLLRVLQDREFERVGESQTKRVDVRVVAATNASLEDLVEAGEFREDLYYRLNVLPVVLPPLRERRDDIPALAQFFLRRYAELNKCPVLDLTAPSSTRSRPTIGPATFANWRIRSSGSSSLPTADRSRRTCFASAGRAMPCGPRRGPPAAATMSAP